MKKTVGGFWRPKSTEADAKVLSIIKEQTEPLHNPYDSAAGFFNDVVDITCSGESNMLIDNGLINAFPNTPCLLTQEGLKEMSTSTCFEEVTPKRVPSESQGKVVKKRGSGSIKKINGPAHIKMLHKNKVTPRKLIKQSSADQLKKLYFKKKCQNADLERKKLMIEILNTKKEHELRMQILKKQISGV